MLVAQVQAAPRACAIPSAAKVLKRSPTATAWQLIDREESTRAFACSRRAGRRVLLEESDFLSGFQLTRVRFAAGAVSYVDSYGSWRYPEGGLKLSVVDLGGTRAKFDLDLMGSWFGLARIDVTSLAITSGGAIAWRYTTDVRLLDHARTDLHDAIGVADERGPRIVATGAPGTLSRLRVRGARVSWTANGTPGSVRLSGWPRLIPRVR